MSDPRDPAVPAPLPADGEKTGPEAEPVAPPVPPRRGNHALPWIAAVIALLLLVGAAPLWAPSLMPLLPWGAAGDRDAEKIAALAARLDGLEAARAQDQHRAAVLQTLEKRVASLEAKPAPGPPPELADLRQQIGQLSAAQKDAADLRQQVARLAAAQGEIADLKQQIGRVSAAQDETGELRRRVGALAETASRLGERIAALEKSAEKAAQSPSMDPGDAALALLAVQMREAIDAGRPFAAEQQALAALAQRRPELAADVAALAEPAKSGVASRAVLSRRLGELAGPIANAEWPAEDDWAGQSWARLRGLVTIRRVAGPGQSEAETAVAAAQRAVAQGDLAGAVAAVGKLTGAPAETARPWLQMARARLAAEDALTRIERQAASRLAAAPAPAPTKGGDPAGAKP